MSLVAEQALFLLDVGRLVEWATAKGWTVTGGELWRTPEQQALYVQTGRSKTLNSQHLKRLAIDLNFFREGQLVGRVEELSPVGDFWESLSPKNVWGGRWPTLKDGPHFERRG
jgi:hypothetical protein